MIIMMGSHVRRLCVTLMPWLISSPRYVAGSETISWVIIHGCECNKSRFWWPNMSRTHQIIERDTGYAHWVSVTTRARVVTPITMAVRILVPPSSSSSSRLLARRPQRPSSSSSHLIARPPWTSRQILHSSNPGSPRLARHRDSRAAAWGALEDDTAGERIAVSSMSRRSA